MVAAVGVSGRLRSVTVGALVAAAWACGHDAQPHARSAAPAGVSLLTVDSATVAVPLSFPAQLYVEHDAVVYARASGIVESVYVDLGRPVADGQLLAQLENVDQSIALDRAEQAYAAAELEVARRRQLAKMGDLSTADSEASELVYQRAALERRQARRNFELARVVAPFAGVVTARLVRPHRLVTAGDSLLRVAAMGPLRASVRVPESTVSGIRPGASADVIGTTGGAARATVIRVSPAVDAASGTREFILQLAPGSSLVPGAAVTVRMGSERRHVVAVAPQAIAEQGYVLVWDHGRSMLRAVTLGATLPDGRLEVTRGLAAGELVVRSAP